MKSQLVLYKLCTIAQTMYKQTPEILTSLKFDNTFPNNQFKTDFHKMF